jgi:hypothetical protein
MIKCDCKGDMLRHSVDTLKNGDVKIRYRCKFCQKFESVYYTEEPPPPPVIRGRNGRPAYREVRP